MSAAPIYEVRNVTKSYGSVHALQDASLALHAGEVIGLVGDNGAGKSTLVKALSGVHQPTSGQIFLDGVERSWKSPHEAIEAGIETLYQDSGLAPQLSVGANVFLGREVTRPGILGKMGFLAQKQMDAKAHAELERVGIAVPASNRSIDQLSGGQRQAVAIGRAVAWAKKVIILDEPTNHLGARQAGEVLEVIKSARDMGLGVIFISHTLPHVLQVTDRVVVLRLGRVVRDAPTSEFDAESLLGTITGLIESPAEPLEEEL
ncbi:ATP-binding cassette domain-containing protein [Nocardioides sp.]|uniref:ATP-binding cassette domain-containing protein n=1 Tax=Nocardioides sp. TaxID=35761 RepID=UPI00286DF8CC|nr:ATP-binding cassette domain-containing protein [Nocardioides sp.]